MWHFHWCRFLKNSINHSDFLTRRKSTREWLPFGFQFLKSCILKISKDENAILPLKLNISAGHTEWWENQRGRFFPLRQPSDSHTRIQSARILSNTHAHMFLDRNIHTLVDRAAHWGGLCFLSVGWRDEVMINIGAVLKCKSVLQHT